MANPKEIDLCRFADVYLQHYPGTDVVLLMGMMKVIVDEKLADIDFINSRCENYDGSAESLKEYDTRNCRTCYRRTQQKRLRRRHALRYR